MYIRIGRRYKYKNINRYITLNIIIMIDNMVYYDIILSNYVFAFKGKWKRKLKKDKNKVIRENTKDRRKISNMQMSSDRRVNEDH